MCYIHSFQTFFFALLVKPFHFTVKTMSHLFQHNISIGIFAGMLAVGCNVSKDFIHIGQVEVSAKCQILCAPVVAPQKRMHV